MFSFAELSEWCSSPWKNPVPEDEIQGVCHDTRTLTAGDVYIAIKGEQFDGHVFVEQAVEKGAVGVIVEREVLGLDAPQLIVSDTMQALWKMAEGTRSGWRGVVVGITGSVGKTTVKELIAAVLSQKGMVSKTLGNWNNDIGLPLSMLAADRNSDFFVFELGMNHPGEIDPLAALLKPDWALITTIGKAHTEFFQGLEGIADEKASLLPHAAHAILDADSEWFDRMKSFSAGDVITLTQQSLTPPQPGAHMILNSRFAATLALQLGFSPEEIQAGLNRFQPAAMRWEETEKGGITFINDAYNANPLSMRAAISTFADLPCKGRKFLVLGGMHELGSDSESEHRALGFWVDSLKMDRILTVGEMGKQILCNGRLGLEKSQVVDLLCEDLCTGDMVLLKASRGERLETILDSFI